MSEPTGERDQIRTVVRDYLISEFLPGEDSAGLEDTTPLISGGILDSVAVVRLVTHFEDKFNIRFESHDITYETFDTIVKMVEMIESKVSQNDPEGRVLSD